MINKNLISIFFFTTLFFNTSQSISLLGIRLTWTQRDKDLLKNPTIPSLTETDIEDAEDAEDAEEARKAYSKYVKAYKLYVAAGSAYARDFHQLAGRMNLCMSNNREKIVNHAKQSPCKLSNENGLPTIEGCESDAKSFIERISKKHALYLKITRKGYNRFSPTEVIQILNEKPAKTDEV
jgi:hypothetical protein